MASRMLMRGASFKMVQGLLGHGDFSPPVREHLGDSLNLLNYFPRGQEMVNTSFQSKKADNLSIANLL
jgi:hypothetical protein